MTKLFLAAAAAIAVPLAAPAAAASCTTTGTGCYIDYAIDQGGTFGNTDPTVLPGRFQDTFTFALNFARTATIQIDSTMAGLDFSNNVNFISNGVTINGTVIPVTSRGETEQRFLANFRLPAGTQQIFVSGSAGVNGVYTGLLSLSGVPEPSTWAMMILGIGLAGGALRARRRKAPRPTFA